MADPEGGMPTHYETKTTHQHTTGAPASAIGIRVDYIKSINGILKIVEIVLSILTFICASVLPGFALIGGGWVQFVSMAAFILTLLLFIFHFINLIVKFPGPWPMIILSLLTFICAIIVYWRGQVWVEFVALSAILTALPLFILQLLNLLSRIPGPWLLIEFIYYAVITALFLIAAIVAAARGIYHSSIAASAFFAFAATAVFAVDTFLQFKNWRSGQTETVATTTTSTSTTIETRQQAY